MRKTLTQVGVLMFIGILFISGVTIVQNAKPKAFTHVPPHKHILAYD